MFLAIMIFGIILPIYGILLFAPCLKKLHKYCWFRGGFLHTPCNIPYCCCAGDDCAECDKLYGPREGSNRI
jgi:hypothetical protein